MSSLFQTILAQVKDRLSLQEHDLDGIAACITEITHVPVTASQLSIKKGVLCLSVPPTLKHAILSRRDAILKLCKDKLITVYDIR